MSHGALVDPERVHAKVGVNDGLALFPVAFRHINVPLDGGCRGRPHAESALYIRERSHDSGRARISAAPAVYDCRARKRRMTRRSQARGESLAPLRHGTICGLPIVFTAPRQGPRPVAGLISITAPISTCSSAPASRTSSRCRLRLVPGRPAAGTFALVDQFVEPAPPAREFVLRQGLRRPCLRLAHPVSPRLRAHLAAARRGREHRDRAWRYLCLHGGPQFSSYAESMTYKNLGYSVIE